MCGAQKWFERQICPRNYQETVQEKLSKKISLILVHG